jgi:prepilin signal peptidase PulO-like enzyme (type II secretory pathway)
MQIEHDPNERRQTNTIWWVIWPIVGLLWAWYLYFFEFSWPALALGILSGGVLATWAIEVTGNKTPEWMKSSPPRRDSNL